MMKSHPRYNTARCWAQTAFVYKKAGTCWTRCVLQWREKKKSWYLNVRWRDRWFMMQDDGQRYQTPRQYVAHGRCSSLYNKWTKGTLLAAVERMFCLALARATYKRETRHIWKRLRHGYCHKIYDLSVGGPFVSCVRSALIRVGREKKNCGCRWIWDDRVQYVYCSSDLSVTEKRVGEIQRDYHFIINLRCSWWSISMGCKFLPVSMFFTTT
jgi:hypothetical protein